MQQIGLLPLISILVVVGVLIAVGIVVRLVPLSPQVADAVPPAVLAQSQTYVDTLGTQPLSTLSTGQKLLVLHAHFNLQHYPMVVQYAETMTDALKRLAPERKAAFGELIETAYRKLGKASEASEFRRQIGY